MCQTRKYKIHIHKYTNTAYDEVPERPNMWYIFEKRTVQGYQKFDSHTIQTWTSEFRTVVQGLVSNWWWSAGVGGNDFLDFGNRNRNVSTYSKVPSGTENGKLHFQLLGTGLKNYIPTFWEQKLDAAFPGNYCLWTVLKNNNLLNQLSTELSDWFWRTPASQRREQSSVRSAPGRQG